jgi:tRNA1Val (adenine37-N6)-methyltransferase
VETTLDGIRDVKLYQNKNGYRFSVDPVLLCSFVNMKYAHQIVDLGTGSGIIGLLLAKKYTASSVLLVELQESLYRLAQKNIGLNSLEDRVKIIMADIREINKKLQPMSYDIVVSNPPFRKPLSGRLSLGEEKSVARHEIKLRLPELVESASYLLKARGRFFMIFQPERILETFDELRKNRLEPKRIRFVYNNIESVSKIVLIEAVKEARAGIKVEKPLFIYREDGTYTDEVDEIYGRENKR